MPKIAATATATATATTATAQPPGTPPHGGRWAWDDQAAEWRLLPDPDAPAAAAADPTTAPE